MRGRAVGHRVASASRTLVEVTAIALTVAWIGSRAQAFTGAVKGNDATGHLAKATFIMDNWPHVSWNYEWYSGQPTFVDYPGYHVLLAGIASAFGVTLTQAMNVVSYGSMVAVAVGLYATVRGATASRLSGVVAACLLLATPTLWSQSVVLGLYPRLAGLGMMALAVAAAVSHCRYGGRWRAALTCVLIALCLSMHPIVGLITIGLVVGVYLLDFAHPAGRRSLTAAAVVVGALCLDAYFYLPLVLKPRSQTLFTDTEVSLTWGMLFHPVRGHLDGLTPVLLPMALAMICFAVWHSRPPEVSFEEKVALGTDIPFLEAMSVSSQVPQSAGPAIRRRFAWFLTMQSAGFAYRIAMLFAASSCVVFAYGLVGQAVDHFPWYVNGLQPADLLVYPAVLLSGVVGLVLVPMWRAVAEWLDLAFEGVMRSTIRIALPIAAVGALSAVIIATVGVTAGSLLAVEATNASIPDRVALLPNEANGQYQYRFAGASDSTTEWVNGYSSTPQTRGYDDHAALHLDWQTWLEESLKRSSGSANERRFLLDWYAVRWIDVDSGSGDLSQYDNNPAAFTPLKSWVFPGTRMQTYAYREATPVVSASSAPAVLLIGDDQHYDLMLRSLALSGVDSRALILVHGPASLDAVTPEMLRSFQSVALYGPRVGNPDRDAAMLGSYVNAGGGLFVDGTQGDVALLVGRSGSPLPVSAQKDTAIASAGWDWKSYGDPTVVDTDLADFGPPSFASSGAWSTQAGMLRPSARPVLGAHGHTVVATETVGTGKVYWEGLNLPYHLATFRSEKEAAFLGRGLLATTTAAPAATTTNARFVNAQRWKVTAAGARGVLLKEQWAPGWHATVGARRATIYPAGPGMMWIPTPASTDPVTVSIAYRLSMVDKLGYAVSVLSVVLLLVYLLSGKMRRRFRRRVRALIDGPTVGLPSQRTATVGVQSYR